MDIAMYMDGIKNAVHNSLPVEYKFEYVDKDSSEFITEVLSVILQEIRKKYLKEEVTYFLREFVTNANKSNIKRVYFQSEKLDINDPEQYQKGIKNFAKQFHDKLEQYAKDFNRYSFYTKVSFLVKNNKLIITVKNSNCPTMQELERVRSLVASSRKIRDIAEAYMTLGDSTEGAGLGLLSSMLMLRSLGLDESAYRFASNENDSETIASVEVPLDTATEMQISYISDLITNEVGALPVFPDKINELQTMLSDKNIAFSKVAQVIQSDLSLTAELLRIVNSAQYMLSQKVSNIQNALSLIGVKGLKNLLYSYGSQNILTKRYGKLDELWQHAYRVASYAFNLSKDKGLAEVQDDAYIGGILHDMGKFIIIHSFPGLKDKIDEHCLDKGVDGVLLERLSVGMSHAKIGAEIAKKWNFPENVVDMISYHHQPLLAPDDSKISVYVVYLANALVNSSLPGFLFSMVEPEVLKYFGLKTKKDFIALEKKMDSYYQQQILK